MDLVKTNEAIDVELVANIWSKRGRKGKLSMRSGRMVNGMKCERKHTLSDKRKHCDNGVRASPSHFLLHCPK